MKRILIALSFLFFHFLSCSAQDTIAFEDGGKIIGKILSVGNKVNYTDTLGKLHNIYKEWVYYIHYSTGEILTLNSPPVKPVNNHDTIKLPILNLAFNYGYSALSGGYGSTYNKPYDNEYCGYANGGSVANLTLNVGLGKRGWSLTFAGDYIQNTFNATDLLNEDLNPYGNEGFMLHEGNQAYKHSTFLGGITKTWYSSSKRVCFGIRLMAGEFHFNFPQLSGQCYANVLDPTTKQYTATLCNWNINQQVITENVYQIGITWGEYLTKNLNLFESCDLLFATAYQTDASGQITSINGNLIANININPATALVMFNFTGGIAYTIW